MSGTDLTRRSALSGAGALALAGAALPALADGPAEGAPDFAAVADGAARLDQLHSVVVMHGGATLFARRFRGPALERSVNVKSVSKTLVALLTGIAIGRGVVPGIDAPMAAVAPRLIPTGADPQVRAITLAHLVTMTAGLQRTSGANYGTWVSSPNWVRHALTRPVVAPPGARFQYSTGAFHLLGAALAEAAGRDLHAMARDWLARPLGIAIPPWTRDPQGRFMGGNNMGLSPAALARVGAMVADGGRWNGTQVVPEAWIEASFQPRTRSPFSGDAYGYGWFLRRLGGERVAYARGYGGQMLYVFRDLPLVVAITSDPTRPARTHGHVGDLHALVSETVLPAVRA
ncbi:MAG: serine hydrolase [Pseudomonadota bacterium]